MVFNVIDPRNLPLTFGPTIFINIFTHTTIIQHEKEIVKPKEISESENEKSIEYCISVHSVTPHSVFSSFSPISDNLVSGPNPGDYPIISLIEEPPSNYYQQVYPTNSYNNPYYSPEEFNYNQDPIDIDHSQDDHIEDANTFKTEAPTHQPTVVTDATEETTEAEAEGDKTINEREPKEHEIVYPTVFNDLKIIDISNLDVKSEKIDIDIITPFVKTSVNKSIDHQPGDNDNIETFTPSLTSLVNCSESREVGFCSMTSSYPKELIESLYEHCSDIIEAFKAFVPEDVDTLGDNSESVISSEKDLARPWSWKVFAYKKKQLCSSDILFIQPSYARDTEGNTFLAVTL